jgi:hypothetical protein
VPAFGAVTAGSFTAFTIPAHPRRRESFSIVIDIQLPEGVNEFPLVDLSGELRCEDGYSRKFPLDRNEPYSVTDKKNRVLDKTSNLQVEAQHVQVLIKVPGPGKLSKHIITIRSKLLDEEQELVLMPAPAAEK